MRAAKDLSEAEALAEAMACLDGAVSDRLGEIAAAKSRELFSDLEALGAHLDIKTNDGEIVTFSGDRWHDEQRRFHRERTGRDLALKARQIGMSTLELARDVQYARNHTGVQVVVCGHKTENVEGLFKTVHLMVEGLVRRGYAPKPKTQNTREIEFGDNHSVIRVIEAGTTEAAADSRGRSGTIHRLHITEMAFWEQQLSTAVALRNAVPANGEITIESTANGAGDLFYDMVQEAIEGKGPYRLHFYPWFEHAAYRSAVPVGFDRAPRDEDEVALRALGCDDSQIQWWREALADPLKGGREKVLQEYPRDPQTCFRTAGGQYVAAAACDRMANGKREPIEKVRVLVERTIAGVTSTRDLGEMLVYARPVIGRTYIATLDTSEGIGNDAHASAVLDHHSGEKCATWANDAIEAGDAGLALAFIARYFNDALAVPERNKDGAAAIRAMQNETTSVTPYTNIYIAEDGREGWHTNPATRPVLFDDLRMAIESGAATTPDARTIAETKTIIRDKDGKPRARGKGSAGGARDDTFVAWAIAWQIRTRVAAGSLVGRRAEEQRGVQPRATRASMWGGGGPRNPYGR